MRYSLFAVLLGAAIVGSVLAAPATAAVPPQTVQEFLGKPSDLLAQYPSGGPEMIQAVQDLVAADRRALPALISLLAPGFATDAQAKAIGTALGRFALTALSTDQALAVEIQRSVVESRNVSAQQAFDAEVGGNIKLTAATTGGGGAETGTGGGGTGFSVSGGGFGPLVTSVGNRPDVFSTTFASGPSGSGGPTSPTTP
jgi:hypothetical protein